MNAVLHLCQKYCCYWGIFVQTMQHPKTGVAISKRDIIQYDYSLSTLFLMQTGNYSLLSARIITYFCRLYQLNRYSSTGSGLDRSVEKFEIALLITKRWLHCTKINTIVMRHEKTDACRRGNNKPQLVHCFEYKKPAWDNISHVKAYSFYMNLRTYFN